MADTPISGLPELTSLADDDWIAAVDRSNVSNNPTGENVKIQKSNLVTGPVVQAAHIDLDGTVLWSSESGWSAVVRSAGIFDVTFPTAAATDNEQALVVSCTIGTEDTANFYQAQVQNQTTTTCTVITGTEANTLASLPFSIHRCLP